MSNSMEDILRDFGEAGSRLDHLDACEVAAGNISQSFKIRPDIESVYSIVEKEVELPLPATGLAGYTVIVSGSGCRLRDLATRPARLTSAFEIDSNGETATWYRHSRAEFVGPTSEFNSHLAVHARHVRESGSLSTALVHAHPPYLTQLSYSDRYASTQKMNDAILRWQPETMIQCPEGIAVLDFEVPGSKELMTKTVDALSSYPIVLWSKHGVMARSDHSPLKAVDLIEYLEAAARYEYRGIFLDRMNKLSNREIGHIRKAFGVESPAFRNS